MRSGIGNAASDPVFVALTGGSTSNAAAGTAANPIQTQGSATIAGGSFTRPADTTVYAIGDLVANSTVAGSVVPVAIAATAAGGVGEIRRARFTTTKTGLAGTEVFRIHFFKLSPTVTNGDNGAFAPQGITAIFLGKIDVTMTELYSDGCKGVGVPAVGSGIVFDTATGSIYALIEARSAYTPISGEVFTIAAEVVR
jgi:hypothetical protein